jgi:serine/threonine protein kinase/tetratricopeptide (TPR) repeat protein
MNEESLFAAALERSDPAERRAFLDAACGGDCGLRRRVERLLAADEQTAGILSRGAAPALESFGLAAGAVLAGRFKLRELLGAGGMGEVWVADQVEPVQRRIALKVIRPGLDSARLVARFEAERQALARMDHPHIAKVLDAGTAEGGRPYFVMELIKGVPITEYCDSAQLSPRARLELFVPVCQAVQHAHQKGVIHRDLKPSNVLIALYDGKPVPKVIDFGVAKATGERLGEHSVYTEVGALVGTLEYMSPEQAELNNLDVDTRSDVYALGVLLYELLTGGVPFPRKDLRSVPFAEMLRIIKEVEPPRPSTRLAADAETLPAVAAARRTEPKKLPALVRGELDWIVMKCLEKDRTRRYETANGLARDVQRFLDEEPVEACPPSVGYRLRKVARKHRHLLAAAGAFALLLAVGIVVSGWQAFRATWAEQATGRERDRAVAEQRRAEDQAAITRAVNDFVLDDLLGQADVANQPQGGKRNPKITVREALDRAAKTIDERFPGQEQTEAAIRLTLGRAYQALGQYPEARTHLERSVAVRRTTLGENHRDTLESVHALAVLSWLCGRYDDAEAGFNQVLTARRAELGDGHADTLAVMINLAALDTERGRYARAADVYRRLVDVSTAQSGIGHPDTLTALGNLGMTYGRAGRLAEAEPLLTRAADGLRAHFGGDHPKAFRAVINLAVLHRERGRYDDAERLLKQVLEAADKLRDPDHPETLRAKGALATVYRLRKQYADAEPLFLEVLKARRAKLDPNHPDTLACLHDLAVLYLETRRPNEAEPLLREALTIGRVRPGESDPLTLHVMNALAQVCHRRGEFDEAERLFTKVLETRRATLGADHSDLLHSLNNLGVHYQQRGRYDRAEPLFVEAVAGARRTLPAGHPFTRRWVENLANNHAHRGHPHLAEPLYRELAALARDGAGPESVAYAGQLARLSGNLMGQKKYAEAEPVAREALAIREKKEPDLWTTFDTQSLLGGALLGQTKYAEAEPFLLRGYRGMKDRAGQIPADAEAHLAEGLERLAALYDAWGKPDEAANWRKELEAVRLPPKGAK